MELLNVNKLYICCDEIRRKEDKFGFVEVTEDLVLVRVRLAEREGQRDLPKVSIFRRGPKIGFVHFCR